VGYSALLVPEKYSTTFDDYRKEHNKLLSGFEAGLNFSVAILDNIQVVVNGGYNLITGIWYKSPVQASAGLRFQF
jgi:hypothetical protein